jgi:hypothetical protein
MNNQDTTREAVMKILQDVYRGGDEGEPEEGAVPSGVDELMQLIDRERKLAVEEYMKEIS